MEAIYNLMSKAITDLNTVRDRLHNHEEEKLAINIIVDDSNPQNQIFVEIENDEGESIRIGVSSVTAEGFRRIRVSTNEIISHAKT